MKQVGICGNFGSDINISNGQIVKTRTLSMELIKHFGKEEISTVNTFGWGKKPVKLFFECFSLVLKCKNIVILPAQNGIKIFVPYFAILNLFFRRKLHYVVIGGWLPKLVDKYPFYIKFLSQFKGIYVETKIMKNELEKHNLSNVIVMPNSKNLKIVNSKEIKYYNKPIYKLCTFSRVMKEKGIEDAINVVCNINKNRDSTIYSLDIYGQIEPKYIERFNKIISEVPYYISYKGCVDADKSTDILKDYFLLLFPTYYHGEGFAGTIIDSYSSGLPILASNWKFNSEIVHNDVGNIFNSIEELETFLTDYALHPEKMNVLKENCLKEAEKYKSENVIKILLNQIR